MADFPVRIKGLRHSYGRVCALDGIDLALPEGCVTGLVGPDGVGKSTLLSLVAGITKIQEGDVWALGGSMTNRLHRRLVSERVAFMPQGLGQNLYGDLTVSENVLFFAALFGIPHRQAEVAMDELLHATGLTAFADQRAVTLSGGMKQKLGLCTVLIREPDLLILDEPTTGVDPLSRRNFWLLVQDVARRKPDRTILVATAYMEEADTFDHLVMIDAGRVFASGAPGALKAQVGVETLEDAYEVLVVGSPRPTAEPTTAASETLDQTEIIIEARDLTRRFGDFTAVDRVNFQIRRAEIYGFIGPNGCGKTTTMKMLTGLLPPSSGEARVFDSTIEAGSLALRRRLGYMSQLFSLYSELNVKQNLELHGRLFDLKRRELQARISEMLDQFELNEHLDQLASDLPVGIRQRLSLAVAVIHQPELLVLDEPTSGVDPLARDKLWDLLYALSREEGTTIFVSTHYLSEAERCDRIALMNNGRLMATDTPAALARSRNTDSLEEAFIASIRDDQARSLEIGSRAVS